VHFVLFSLLACPPNYLWQSWLEGRFPGYTEALPQSKKEKLIDDAVSGRGTSADSRTSSNGMLKSRSDGAMTEQSVPSQPVSAAKKAQRSLNKKNTAIKFALDQTIGTAANTVIFIAGIALLRGQSWEVIGRDVVEQFWPMIFAGQKLWPAVSLLQFTVVPFEYRTLVGSLVGLVWGVILSLMAGKTR
jgi:protein Mpv17